MKPALYVAALSLLMSLPAQAYEVETGPVMLCDTQQQAERFVQHFAGNQEAAIGAVNAEERNPHACAIVEVAYVPGEPLGIERTALARIPHHAGRRRCDEDPGRFSASGPGQSSSRR